MATARGSGGFEISLRGLHAVAPTRADALPLIEAALRKHEAIAGSLIDRSDNAMRSLTMLSALSRLPFRSDRQTRADLG